MAHRAICLQRRASVFERIVWPADDNRFILSRDRKGAVAQRRYDNRRNEENVRGAAMTIEIHKPELDALIRQR